MYFKTFIKENRDFVIMALFAAIFLFVAFLPQNKEQKQITVIKTDQVIEKKLMNYQSVLNSIEAKSFYVYDILDQKSLFSKEEHSKLPLASITKLMSGLVILDIMPETTEIIIKNEDLALEGDSGLVLGEKWKLK